MCIYIDILTDILRVLFCDFNIAVYRRELSMRKVLIALFLLYKKAYLLIHHICQRFEYNRIDSCFSIYMTKALTFLYYLIP